MDSYQSLTEPVEGDLQQECNQCGQSKRGGPCNVKTLLTPFLIRETDVGAVHDVGALRGSPRPPPRSPGSARWLPVIA